MISEAKKAGKGEAEMAMEAMVAKGDVEKMAVAKMAMAAVTVRRRWRPAPCSC